MQSHHKILAIISLFAPACGTVESKATDPKPDAGPAPVAADADASIPPGTPAWALRFGDSGEDTGDSVLVDSDGSIVAAGSFTGAIDTGGATLTSAGMNDLFMLRRQADGAALSAVRYGGTDRDSDPRLASLPARNVVIGATFGAMTDLGNHTASGPNDALVAGLTATFARVWSYPISSFFVEDAHAIASDATGRAVVVGAFAYTVTIGSTTLTGDGIDGYIASFGTNGSPTWAKGVGGGTGAQGPNDVVTSVAIDDAGNVYAAGWFTATANVVGMSYTSIGDTDIFIVKLDSAGNVLWRYVYGGTMTDIDPVITVDASRNVYMSAQFQGTSAFGGVPVTGDSDARHNAVIVKYDTSGGFVWQARAPAHIATMRAAADGIHVGGSFQGTADLGGGVTVTSAGGNDALVARLSPSGTWTWARAFGGLMDDQVADLAVMSNGADVITGAFQGTGTFGHYPLTSAGLSDAFLACLSP